MGNLTIAKQSDGIVILRPGTVIFTQGQLTNQLYLIKSGEVSLVRLNGPKMTLIKTCKDREILNEVSVILGKPTEFAAITKTNAELVMVSKKDIDIILKAGPSWIPEILQTLCERLISTEEMIHEHQLLLGSNEGGTLSKEEEKKYATAIAEFRP